MAIKCSRYVAILDVGHGNSCVVRDDEGVIVIDTGLGTSLMTFLEQEDISHVDVVLLSHADQDHISGLVQLLASKEFTIGRVRVNTDVVKSTKRWKNLMFELEDQDMKGLLNLEVQLTSDSEEDYSQGRVSVEVLSPGKAFAGLGPGNKTSDGKKITAHSVSCVIRLSQDEKAIAVFPGDIDALGLEDMVRRINITKKDVTSPLLVYPHHGGLGGTHNTNEFTKQLCEVFKPISVIFSIGREKHGNPRPEVVETMRHSIKNLRIACTQLSKHCSKDIPNQEPQHLLPLYAEGQQLESCCAGTMLINLDACENFLPSQDKHAAFVAEFGSNALCKKEITSE